MDDNRLLNTFVFQILMSVQQDTIHVALMQIVRTQVGVLLAPVLEDTVVTEAAVVVNIID